VFLEEKKIGACNQTAGSPVFSISSGSEQSYYNANPTNEPDRPKILSLYALFICKRCNKFCVKTVKVMCVPMVILGLGGLGGLFVFSACFLLFSLFLAV
jgi:hypothetical protein